MFSSHGFDSVFVSRNHVDFVMYIFHSCFNLMHCIVMLHDFHANSVCRMLHLMSTKVLSQNNDIYALLTYFAAAERICESIWAMLEVHSALGEKLFLIFLPVSKRFQSDPWNEAIIRRRDRVSDVTGGLRRSRFPLMLFSPQSVYLVTRKWSSMWSKL